MMQINSKMQSIMQKVFKYVDEETANAIHRFIYEYSFSKSNNTVKAYLYDILIGVKFFFDRHKSLFNLFDSTLGFFRLLIGHQKEKDVSIASQQRLLCTWKMLFRRHDIAILSMFKFPKLAKRYPKPASKETIDKIMQLDETNIVTLQNKALWVLMYSSGMRISEALSLRTDSIVNQCAKIRGKGGKEREVSISRVAINLLNKYINAIGRSNSIPDLIFTNNRNLPLSQQAASQAFKRWARQAMVTEVCSLHSLRHAFASHVLKNGCPLTAIQKTLGHKNLSTTTQYLNIENQYLESAFRKYIT